MKKLFFFAAMCLMALSMSAQDYVDLGLPSGTKWKSQNESSHYSYDLAIVIFKNNLPTKEQFEELREKCTWTGSEEGWNVEGPNGNSIFLPADGGSDCNGNIDKRFKEVGRYWTSTSYNGEEAWYLCFAPVGVQFVYFYKCHRHCIRLVSK